MVKKQRLLLLLYSLLISELNDFKLTSEMANNQIVRLSIQSHMSTELVHVHFQCLIEEEL